MIDLCLCLESGLQEGTYKEFLKHLLASLSDCELYAQNWPGVRKISATKDRVDIQEGLRRIRLWSLLVAFRSSSSDACRGLDRGQLNTEDATAASALNQVRHLPEHRYHGQIF